MPETPRIYLIAFPLCNYFDAAGQPCRRGGVLFYKDERRSGRDQANNARCDRHPRQEPRKR